MVKVAGIIREADIAVGNLESPFASKTMLKDRFNGLKGTFMYSVPCSVTALQFAGFDIMSLANNHLNDYGEKPVNFTRNILSNAGIESFGSNFGSYDSPQQSQIQTKKGIKVGFLGYCYTGVYGENNSESCSSIRKAYKAGPAIYSDHIAERDVRKLKSEGVKVVIVYMHWGREFGLHPDRKRLLMTKYLYSLGVTAVIGAHSHILQSHSLTNEHFAAYSLGNFLFPLLSACLTAYKNKPWNYPTMLSRILRLQVSRNGVIGAKYLPVAVKFDHKTKTLQPTLSNGTHWIDVCSKKDEACLRQTDLKKQG